MLDHRCDWCGRSRKAGEEWLLGFSAQRVGARSTRREFRLAPSWSEVDACSDLAVHFCCEAHLKDYVAALFATKLRPAVGQAAAPRKASASAIAVMPRAATTRAAARTVPRPPRPRLFNDADELRAHAMGVRLE